MRREAAGLSIDDLAARIGTSPHRIPEHDRSAWLRLIEAGEAAINDDDIDALTRLCGADTDPVPPQPVPPIDDEEAGAAAPPDDPGTCSPEEIDA